MLPSSLHMRQKKWRKVPCLLHTAQDLIRVITYDVIFPLSPCFSGLKCSCLLGYCYYRSCFGFLPLYQPFTLPFPILLYSFWDGRAKICYSIQDVATPWSCLACAKDTLHRPEGMGMLGYRMFVQLRALCCTALCGLCWPYLPVGDACARIDDQRAQNKRTVLANFPTWCSKGHAYLVGWGVSRVWLSRWWLGTEAGGCCWGDRNRKVQHSQEYLLALSSHVWYHQQSVNHCGCCSFASV